MVNVFFIKSSNFQYSNTATKSLTDKYDVIYSEWIEGFNGLTENTDFSTRLADTTSVSGGVIYPHVVAAKYETAAKYNYHGKDTNASATNNE